MPVPGSRTWHWEPKEGSGPLVLSGHPVGPLSAVAPMGMWVMVSPLQGWAGRVLLGPDGPGEDGEMPPAGQSGVAGDSPGGRDRPGDRGLQGLGFGREEHCGS